MHSNRRCTTRTIIGVQGRCIQCHQYFVLCGGNTKTRMGVDRKKEKSSWRCTVAQRLQVPLSLEMRWWYQHAASGSDGSSVAIDSTIGQGEKKGKTENEQKEYERPLPARALRYGQGCARNHLRGRSHANNAATSIESRCRRIRRKRREQKREYWSEKKVRRPGFTQSPYQLKSTSMSNSTTYPGPGPLPKQT